MRVKFIVLDDDGNQFEGETVLSPAQQKRLRKRHVSSQVIDGPQRMDFDMNERAFAKQHAGGLSGPKKFALLLAYLAKGDCSKRIPLKDIQKCWDRMTALLGGKFYRKYSNKAREYGWADTKKTGTYVLRPHWLRIFASQEKKQ